MPLWYLIFLLACIHRPYPLDCLSVDIIMHWTDKVLSMTDNLVIVHPIVDGGRIVVSSPGVRNNDTAW